MQRGNSISFNVHCAVTMTTFPQKCDMIKEPTQLSMKIHPSVDFAFVPCDCFDVVAQGLVRVTHQQQQDGKTGVCSTLPQTSSFPFFYCPPVLTNIMCKTKMFKICDDRLIWSHHRHIKGGYRKFFFSSIGPVGHNIWWENSLNGPFGPINGPKMQKTPFSAHY